MSATTDQFGKALITSGLMTSDEVKSLWAAIPAAERPKDGSAFASLLVKRGKLTEFQAKELLSGSNTPLVLGDYLLLSRIGAGGMGQVFKAQHRHMDRLAAIKLLPAAMTKDEGAVKRFQREVKAAAKLSHPNIVQTFDASVQRGVWYLVMECVEGQDLSAIVKERGPLPVNEACDYIQQAARGLAYAHGKGVVHRDIKPANLLLDNEGTVKILDMGLARFDESGDAADHQLTSTGQVMGTVDYMAPEQAASTHNADARSDIYSLGCSLYRLLTGSSVFSGNTVVEKLMAHLNAPVPSLCAQRPDVPAEVDRIFQKMLAKQPANRYQQASQLVADLEAWRKQSVATASTGLASSEPDSKLTDFVRTVQTPSVPAIAPASQKAATLDRVAEAAPEQTVAYIESEIETDPKSEASVKAESGKGKAEASPAASARGAVRNGKKPPAKMMAAGFLGALFLLAGVIVIIRNQQGAEVGRVDAPPGTKITPPPGGSVEIQANATTATANSSTSSNPQVKPSPGDVTLTPLDALKRDDISPEALTTAGWGDPAGARAPAELVAVLGEGRMMHWHRVVGAAYLPDGRSAVSAGNDGIIRFWDVDTGRQRFEIVAGGNVRTFAVSPDGATFAVNIPPSNTIKLWNTATGAFVAELKGHTDNVTALSFSPNSQTLASGSTAGEASIKLWSLATREATATLIGHTDTVSGLAFSPDGKRLASGSKDKTVKLWNVETAQEQTTLRGHDGDVCAVAFAPDGHSLVTGSRFSGSQPLIVWNADSGEEIKTLPAGECYSLAFSADGQQIFSGGTAGRLSAWDVATGKKIGQATDLGTTYTFYSLSLSPNGKSLLLSAGTAVRELDLGTLKLNRLGTGYQASLTAVAISPDSRWIASAAFDGQGVNVWDAVTRETRTLPANAKSDVLALAFSPDSRTIATGGRISAGADALVQLWDVIAGREIHAIPTRGSVDSLAFSPSGQTLAWCDLSMLIRLWDVATQRETTALKGHEDSAKDFAWSRDGRVMVSVDRKGIARIWDVASGQSSAITIGPHGVASIAMSPDGNRFATAVPSSVPGLPFVQMWDVADEKELATFKKIPILADLGHHALAFSPDGRQLAVVAGGVPNVRLCDVDTGRVMRSIALNRSDVEGGATCVAFDATGRYLIAGNNNGTVYVLRLAGPPPEAAVANLKSPISNPPPIGPAPPLAVAPFDAAQAQAHQAAWAKHLGTQVETINSVGAKMILIPPGEFLMGSTDEQVEAALKIGDEININPPVKQMVQDECPQHRVVITKPYWLGATEVTTGQYKRFVAATGYQTEHEKANSAAKTVPPASSPGRLQTSASQPLQTYLNFGFAVTDDLPVTRITWNDAMAYCQWLSSAENASYRLPTEAEWEYACRAGTTTLYSFGDDSADFEKFGWYQKNSGGRWHPVGMKLPNAFGLFDMHGNLLEWCGDFHDPNWYAKSLVNDPKGPSAGSNRVVHGGNWETRIFHCRSAWRYIYHGRFIQIPEGFRVVRELDAPSATAVSTTSTPPVVAPPAAIKTVGPQPPPAVAPFDAKTARSHQEAWARHLGTQVETTNSVGAKMILIPPGEFLMGSTDEQVEAALKVAEEIKADQPTKDRIQKNERPQHKVVITKPLLMSATELAIGQFKKFAAATGYQTEAEKAEAAAKAAPPPVEAGQPPPKPIQTYINPGYVATDDMPVAFITWNDAVAYCQWLSEQEKTTYRLPTEAEWEYACRAGTTTQYSFGDDVALLDQYAWYNTNAGGRSHPVGAKLPNGFGLFDMHGNLYEWCGDYWDEKWYEKSSPNDPIGSSAGSNRVLRGGYWNHLASNCRSASRHLNTPSGRTNHYGFRCVSVW